MRPSSEALTLLTFNNSIVPSVFYLFHSMITTTCMSLVLFSSSTLSRTQLVTIDVDRFSDPWHASITLDCVATTVLLVKLHTALCRHYCSHVLYWIFSSSSLVKRLTLHFSHWLRTNSMSLSISHVSPQLSACERIHSLFKCKPP